MRVFGDVENLILLGGRSMVGHAALDRVIGVRIPASQPFLLKIGQIRLANGSRANGVF